ncbi:TetR family transcriptional regulator [Cohnella luojiensis]|uniref:TetR/AcrR family transcriptional regulator n=1 Tax=Cohnella luojiensis TaxID=652876 RepID=A0A4Y8LW74_9BACL|nr:TetR family transcriptional regulator [Cohnella luojiensis]TFE25973.1 TetR/AcrR family transcriptional regulator [Cohnella luojiensis]
MANDLPLNKETILDAAEQVLRRYGPDKTSVVDVAKVLQVSHGTLYRHFASKASLREAVTERWLQRSIADPLETIASQTEGSSAERLHLWLETLITSKRTYAADDSEMFAMYASVTLDAVEMITTHIGRLIHQIAQIIENGIKSKEFKSGQPEILAKAIFFATSRFHHPAHAYEWIAKKTDEEFDSVWNLILSGLATSKS